MKYIKIQHIALPKLKLKAKSQLNPGPIYLLGVSTFLTNKCSSQLDAGSVFYGGSLNV